MIGETIATARNQRFSSRLRGALRELRGDFGDDAVLLVALFLPWRSTIYNELLTLPNVEENSSNKTSRLDMEEE